MGVSTDAHTPRPLFPEASPGQESELVAKRWSQGKRKDVTNSKPKEVRMMGEELAGTRVQVPHHAPSSEEVQSS